MQKICTFLICKLRHKPVYFTCVLKPLLIDRSTIFHSSLLLLLFLTVVMDILNRNEAIFRSGADRCQPLGGSPSPHLQHQERHIWDTGLVSTMEAHLNAVIYLPLFQSAITLNATWYFLSDFFLHARPQG